jgi:V8-like Glu-specific endopeptidase
MIGYDSEMEFYADLARQQSGEFEIFGNDDRRFVANTLDIPFRFVCCLDLVFRNPSGGALLRLRGSGTLISDRHVLTVAHNVLDDMSVKNPALRQLGIAPFPIRYLRAQQIIVAPARNGRNLPANFTTVTNMRVSRRWQAVADNQQAQGNTRHLSTDAQDDFALLTLNNPLGALPTNVITMQLPAPPLGFWSHPRFGGGTRIRPIEVRTLRNQTMNVSGYPIDKCLDQPRHRPATAAELAACTGHVPDDEDFGDRGSTQWVSSGTILNPSPATEPRAITYAADMAEGESGAPVWLRWEQFRNLIAINTGGSPRATAPFDTVANMGVRITDDVLREIRTWMRLDGVQPTF